MNDWIDRKKGWLNGARKKKRKPEPKKEPVPYGVTWKPIRCPKCDKKTIKITKTVQTETNPIRYCECKSCKKTFKAVEED